MSNLKEERILHFARYCWRNQRQLTPKRRITWERLFEEMHGEPLISYARRKQDEQNLSQKSSSKVREKV